MGWPKDVLPNLIQERRKLVHGSRYSLSQCPAITKTKKRGPRERERLEISFI
jgi:hypothetical protein